MKGAFHTLWRPFIGWTCGVACLWNWVILSVLRAACEIAGNPIPLVPADITEMAPVLLGVLGLGAFRTVEKIKGIE